MDSQLHGFPKVLESFNAAAAAAISSVQPAPEGPTADLDPIMTLPTSTLREVECTWTDISTKMISACVATYSMDAYLPTAWAINRLQGNEHVSRATRLQVLCAFLHVVWTCVSAR